MKCINDSLESVVYYIVSAVRFVCSERLTSSTQLMQAVCPFQVDVCVVTGEPTKNKAIEYVDQKDVGEDEHEDTDQKSSVMERKDDYVDVIDNIRKRLNDSKLAFATDKWDGAPVKKRHVFRGLYD
eukprot:331287_1